jgi:integrase/recombinase XerD
MSSFPDLVRTSSPAGETRFSLGDPLVDSYLEFVAGRTRPNTLRAVAHDLKAFFTVVDKQSVAVVPADVFEFLADQRGDRSVVRMSDGESGLSARTIARRLSSVSGFYAYLVARGDTPVETNPVPKGLSTRRRGGRVRTVPLVRVPRTLPKVLSPRDVDALVGALRGQVRASGVRRPPHQSCVDQLAASSSVGATLSAVATSSVTGRSRALASDSVPM